MLTLTVSIFVCSSLIWISTWVNCNVHVGFFCEGSKGLKAGSDQSQSARTQCHVVDLKAKNLLIAVPAGYHIEPGTLLTHPHTGEHCHIHSVQPFSLAILLCCRISNGK